MRAQRVGGLIFAASPHHLASTPLLTEAGMPKVAIYSQPAFADIPAVVSDVHSFVDQALDWLATQGRRHLALLSNAVYEADDASHRLSYFADQVDRRALITRPAWMQCPPSPYSALAIEHATLALPQTSLRGQPDTAVDGLVILDDNLVAPALAVVRSCGLRLPADDRRSEAPNRSNSFLLPQRAQRQLEFEPVDAVCQALNVEVDQQAGFDPGPRMRCTSIAQPNNLAGERIFFQQSLCSLCSLCSRVLCG